MVYGYSPLKNLLNQTPGCIDSLDLQKKCNSLFYLEGFIESKNLSKEAYLIQGIKRTGNIKIFLKKQMEFLLLSIHQMLNQLWLAMTVVVG